MQSESHENLIHPWIFPRVWGVGLLLLMTATWPLWFPGPSPQMPLIPLLPLIPTGSALALWIGHAVSVLLVISLVLVVISPLRYRRFWWLIAGCLIVSFFVDQHRLQPWAYQSSIYAMVFASMDRITARRWLIALAASVYLYSAAGKFDYQFTHTVGQDFLKAVMDPLGGPPGERVRTGLALVFPSVELIAGLCILIPKARPVGAWLVIAMHTGLIAILGPWNRDHSHGVLLWNALLIAQAYLLLIRVPQTDASIGWEPEPSSSDSPWHRVIRMGVRMILVSVMVAPLLERRGYWDHWTSWSLYSPHTSRVDIEIHQTAIDRLSPSMLPHVQPDADHDGWCLLDTASWSLATRKVPIYPQARYQLALAADLARQCQLSDEIRARLLSTSDRWSGMRTELMMRNRNEIDVAMKTFWLRGPI